MKLMISQSNLKQISIEYHIYFFFVTLLIALQLVCNLIIGVQTTIFGFNITASAIFYVFSFAISDLIAERYGFERAVKATVYNLISQIIFCGITLIVVIYFEINISSQGGASVKYFYDIVAREFFSSTLSLIVGKTANDFFIVYFGRKLMWKFFAIRTIVCTIIGEIVMLQIDYNITFFGVRNYHDIQKLIFVAMIYKVIMAILLSAPTAFLAKALKSKVYLTVDAKRINNDRFIISFFKALKLW